MSVNKLSGAEKEVIRHVVGERREMIEGIVGLLSAVVGEGEALSSTIAVALMGEVNRIEVAGGDSYGLFSLEEVRALARRIDVRGDVDMQNELKAVCAPLFQVQVRW
ncbi:MAG: hypothetical protein HYV65_03400 [Candidatus Spechtbacteria bacterium]|nr:hypothetical protein [Candidatus Spechtbacteria bacterium]